MYYLRTPTSDLPATMYHLGPWPRTEGHGALQPGPWPEEQRGRGALQQGPVSHEPLFINNRLITFW